MQRIYFDYAATTPTDPQVQKAMEPYFFEHFGNPSSVHGFGQDAKKALENSRQVLADFIGAKPDEIIFTSGATESNNHVLLGVADALRTRGNHIIMSAIEHHSIMDTAHQLAKKDFKLTMINVDKDGLINPDDIKKAITDKTILISIMHANNEIGVIEPIAEIGKIAKERNIYFHSDCAQTIGHTPVNVDTLNVDFLSLSAHKFYGPKGVGALYVRKSKRISPFLIGGGQESGRRASTQNVAGIVGLSKAVLLCKEKMMEEAAAQTALRDRIINEVQEKISDCFLNGSFTSRLPNNVNFSFSGVNGESLLMSLDMAGIAASMGAACTSGALEPSYVLRSIGLSDTMAMSSLRITLGRWTIKEHVDVFLKELPPIIERLRVLSGSSRS